MWKRIKNLVKGFFGLFIGGLEKRNPEALLQVEKENLREQIAKFNKGLAAHAGLCERLMTQVKKLEKEHDSLRAKTSANLKAGNKKLAGQYALRLKGVSAELAENQEQLQEAETTYKELIGARDVSVKAARTKIEELRRDISDVKMSTAMAELNEMASGMVNEIGEGGDTLNRLSEMLQEEKEKAAGRARVARDSMDTSEIKAVEAEQDAMEDLALADFAAAEGIALESEESAPPAASKTGGETTKTMGPTETE